jgi:hypothetical protein
MAALYFAAQKKLRSATVEKRTDVELYSDKMDG